MGPDDKQGASVFLNIIILICFAATGVLAIPMGVLA